MNMPALLSWFRHPIRTFRAWRTRRLPPSPLPMAIIPMDPEPTADAVITLARPEKIKRADRTHWKRDIAATLDGLNTAFKKLSKADIPAGMVSRDVRIGLRNLGPYDVGNDVAVSSKMRPGNTNWPGLVFVALDLDNTDADKVYPDFFYATKLKKTPWNCTSLGGVIYECGCAYPIDGKLYWIAFYAGITPATGKVVIAKQLGSRSVYVRDKKTGEQFRINRREWHKCAMEDEDRSGTLPDLLPYVINLWATKDNMWSVSARRNGARMTFCILPSETSSYFRDRGRTAMTKAGRLRPIIHHVQEHQRVISAGKTTTVKEHLRGLRNFVWNGYECAVTAPKFHAFAASKFDLAGESFDEDEIIPTGTISLDKLADRLASLEDGQPSKASALALMDE